MRNDTPASVRIRKARTTLLLDHPFFGALLFRLKCVECRSVRTMATDGVSLYWNPEFVETLSAATLAGTLAHEVMHPALHHHLRRSARDPGRWNVACDYAINPLLVDAGLSLPEGVLLESRFRGMSAEQIYNLLEFESEPENSLDGEDHGSEPQAGSGWPPMSEPGDNPSSPAPPETEGGIGQVLDAPPSHGEIPTPKGEGRDWEVAVNQAVCVSKQAGRLPAGVERVLKGAAEAVFDWRELLHRSWSETNPAGYSWMRPNRRHLWTGLYLPSVVREGVGEVAIAVDCSGSVSGRQLRLFEAEVRSILEGQRPERVYVLYFDGAVQRVDVCEAGQRIDLSPIGGGGTHFGPCFEWLDQRGIRPQSLVFLTDLYGSFPDSEPDYPVLWASTGRRHAPFGEVVPLQAS